MRAMGHGRVTALGFWHRWVQVRPRRVCKRVMVFVYGIAALSVYGMTLAARVLILYACVQSQTRANPADDPNCPPFCRNHAA